MLVQTSAAMNPYGMGPEDFAMYEKSHHEQYMQAYDPMAMSFGENQHRAQLALRQSKKSKPPIESFQNYVAIVQDPYTGKLVLRSSSTMKNLRHAILGGEAMSKFRAYTKMVHEANSSHVEDFDSESGMFTPEPELHEQAKESSDQPRQKRKRKNDDLDVSESSELSHKEATSWQQDEDPEDDDCRYVTHRADATGDWEKWFNDAFRAVQQVSCRVIAKEWIKAIHPKKQSTHPYNGKNPRTREIGDPNLTKPPYWPKDVIHKEPDHINKEARTKLLVHLLMHTPHREMSSSGEPRSAREITAEVLQESLKQKKLERDMTELGKKFPIIEQIIEVRKSLEQFEDGGIDGDTMITAPNYSDYNRGSKNDEADDDADEPHKGDDDQEGSNQGFEDLIGELPRDTQASNTNSTNKPRLPDMPGEKETKSKRGGRKTSKHDEFRSAVAPSRRREPRAQVSTSQPSMLNIHPPLILPDWDNEPIMPTMSGAPHYVQHNLSAHGVHDAFDLVNWAAPVHNGLNLNSQSVDQHMITPPPMPNVMPPASYVDVSSHHGSQQSFAGASHGSQFDRSGHYQVDMHNTRHAPLRAPTPYEAFMGQGSPSHEMFQQPRYYM